MKNNDTASRQYVYCPDRKGNPHIPIEVCRTKCESYATCRAGGLDEIETAKSPLRGAKTKPVAKAKRVRVPKPSVLSRILEED